MNQDTNLIEAELSNQQTQIHPQAIVDEGAALGEGVRVEPFAVIHHSVSIGARTVIMSGAVILPHSTIGSDCVIYPGAVIGADPQDLRFDNRITYTTIGDRTTIRECVTVNRGSHSDNTSVGNDCLIMAYSHIAHDCTVGNNVVIANASQLGGHVEIGDWAILGGVSKVHQFCKVGAHAMIAADAMVTKDVVPYALTGRSPVKIEGVNKVGLRRRGFSTTLIDQIDAFYSVIFFSGHNMTDGLAKYEAEHTDIAPEIQSVIDFIRQSKRGAYR
jgi:UDP-N-acetylglucosamine acyltransferase